MEIALLKSKNQFVLKTNPPTHTPFFLFLTDSKKNQPTTEKQQQQQQQLLQNWHYFFKNKTSKQINSLFSSCLQTAIFFFPSMLTCPQLKSPINLISQKKTPPPKKETSSSRVSTHKSGLDS
jgi:hypothetical protein